MMTPEKIRGNQFEIWLEEFLKLQGYKNVLRDVEYHKDKNTFRQADISYNYIVSKNHLKLMIVEAKYSSNGYISYKLRAGEKEKSGQVIRRIDNLVDEVWERQNFIGADQSILVTNKKFENKVRTEAFKKGVKVLEGDDLQLLFKKFGYLETIDESISKIDLRKHNLYKNVIYLDK